MKNNNYYKMNFANIPVSTQTFTVRSNIEHIELQNFYELLQTTTKKTDNDEGEIVCIKYKMLIKGEIPITKVKKRKSDGKPDAKKNFLNCVTLIIQVEKKINVKIFKNGVFQLTGCKNISNVKKCLHVILTELSKFPDCFKFSDNNTNFVIYIKSAMRNIDFDLGFKINRTLLAIYLHQNTNYSVPPLTTTNMGVKLKIPLKNVEDLPITKITYPSRKEDIVSFKECFSVIEPDVKKLQDKLNNKFISISIFQNGKVLMSGIDETFQEKYYNWLIDLLHTIKEKIVNPDTPVKTFKPVLLI
jgi:TATA-box binding protein (TBP) (component of TFIID and TFIIIB)